MRVATIAVLAMGVLGASVSAQTTRPTSAGSATAPVTRPATTAPATRPALVVPQTPGTHRVTSAYVTVEGKELKLPFVLFLPDTYREKGPKLPVLLFLHGLGECGTDLDAIFYHGPNFELAKNNTFTHSFPMIVISPQCPPRGQRWDRGNMDEHLNALLDQVLPKLNADQDRVYATGLSMGGLGTWYVARNRPSRFAGIAPVSSLELDPAGTSPKLKHTAVLAVTGEGDGAQIDQSRRMVAAIQKQGGLAEHVTGPDGHVVWIKAYAQPRTYEWLLLNHRGQPLPADETWPEKRGIHAMSAAPTTQPAQRIDYLLRLPSDLKFPQRNRPMLAYFADPERFGKYQQNLPLHGPMQFMADTGPGKALPFIVLQVMLPPFSRCTPDDMASIVNVLKNASARYKTDQLYLAGSGEAADLALQMSRMADVKAAAVVLDVAANTRFEPATPEKGTSTVVLAVTNRADGDVHTRLKTLVEHSSEGSELAVQSQTDEQSAFFYPDLYQQLLKIRIKPERR